MDQRKIIFLNLSKSYQMDSINTNRENSARSLWALILYFVLCFYHFGEAMMTYFINYKVFDKVHENVGPFMTIFVNRMAIVSYFPDVLLVIATLVFVQSHPKSFPRWAIWTSSALGFISVATSFAAILPIHLALPATGFSEAIQNQLLPISLNFQIIPAAMQVLIVLWLMNRYLNDSKPVGRWLLILVCLMTYYTLGTSYVEEFVNYPGWLAVGENDWMSFRKGGNSFAVFACVYLLPGFLQIFLFIAMIWLRPKGIPRLFPGILLLSWLWTTVTTATYFVPDLQLVLDKGYSRQLIEELMRNSVLYRELPGLISFFIPAWMFLKAGQLK
jgi:hypothetical protein